MSSKLPFLQLSQKVCMLVLLLTGQREQRIHLLKVEDVIFHADSLELKFSAWLKHTRPGVHQDIIRFQSYIQNKSLCIVSLLREYKDMTFSFKVRRHSYSFQRKLPLKEWLVLLSQDG